MPTIDFSLKDLAALVGKRLTAQQVGQLVEYGKGELKSYDKKTDQASVSFDDTNLPYLWSAEGVAILIKGALGIESGIPKLETEKTDERIIVNKNIAKIRPHIAAFSVRGKKVNDYLIKQIIQLQEKLCECYGRKRKKVAIGVYPHTKIKFPVTYKAVRPEHISFVPLEFKRELDLAQILSAHPTGRKYAFTLEGFKKYPILIDSNKQVLSFPPIINSENLGKVEIGEQDLFVEVTGTDFESVNLCTNIFATALAERGFKICSVTITYPDKKITTPFMFNEKIKIKKEKIERLIGIHLSQSEIKRLAEKARYNFKNFVIDIPHYRQDILHPVDVIEDIAIMYGYDRIPTTPLTSYSVGEVNPMIHFIDKVRDVLAGFGFQEVLSPMLSNKECLYDKMAIKDFGTVEIKECMSLSYSVVRTWLIPILMELLSKNKHHDYPQRVFEQGLVTVRKGNKIVDYERAAALSCGIYADYTKIKQVFDALMVAIGLSYRVEETEHGSFIPGRVGRVIVDGKGVAYIGELHPKVLANWQLEMPVAGFELNLSELFGLMAKK